MENSSRQLTNKYFRYVDIYGKKLVVDMSKVSAIEESTLIEKDEESSIVLNKGDTYTTIYTDTTFFEVNQSFEEVLVDLAY